MKKNWIRDLLLVGSVFLNGAQGFAQPAELEHRAALFHLGILNPTSAKDISVENRCIPIGLGACVEFVAGSTATRSDRLEAARVCSGNFGGDCAKFVAGSSPTTSDRREAATVCQGNYGSACASFVAGSSPTRSDRIEAAENCRFVDAECVKFVAGSTPTRSDRIEAAKACSGQ